jgi:hypothetical protein
LRGFVTSTTLPAAWNGGAEDPISGDVVYWFDFSSVTTPGEYNVRDVVQNLRSVTFRIDDTVYRGVLGHAVRSFYYQRAGQEKSVEHAGAAYADAASHPIQRGLARQLLGRDREQLRIPGQVHSDAGALRAMSPGPALLSVCTILV